jgi:hypothetical protein
VTRRGLGRLAASSLLLAGGLLLYLMLAIAFARPADAAAEREMRIALTIYAGVVLAKGLLPQLWIALALGSLFERRFAARVQTRRALAVVLAVAALAAGLLVAPTLLPASLPGLPPVVFAGPGNFALTVLQMSAAVAAAALLPRLAIPALR